MKAAILTVGTELLFGQVVNTNAAYLSSQLNLLGIDVMFHYTVGDNPDRLRETLQRALHDVDLIITTGGLGPTQDDLTKEVVSEVLEDRLELHQESMDSLNEIFEKRGIPMTSNNIKQAWLPSRATVFRNIQGTAPGFALSRDEQTIVCLPGPPREMKSIFSEGVKPYLLNMTEDIIYYKMIRTFGIGEARLETELLPLIDGQSDPTIATYAKEGESCVRVASKRKNRQEAEAAVNEMIDKIRQYVGKFIYSTDDEEYAEVVSRKLLSENITISCAESCTGGMFAVALTDISGISEVFDRGLVTYSNKAKIEELGVSADTLEKFGAVSRETALEMARGVKRVSGTRMSVSSTGIAGPGGGTPEKPVGLVFIAAVFDDQEIVKELRLRYISRKWNRTYTVLAMMDMINKLIDND